MAKQNDLTRQIVRKNELKSLRFILENVFSNMYRIQIIILLLYLHKVKLIKQRYHVYKIGKSC